MATLLNSLIIIVVVAGMVWILRSLLTPKRRGTRPIPGSIAKPGDLEKLRSSHFFWGVSIYQPGCPAARRLQGQQYTFDEAPELPVPGCGSARCTCQFKGLRERRVRDLRKQEDRRDEVRFDMDRQVRRSHKGRRRSDKWEDHTD